MTKTKADTGFGKMVNLLPITREAVALRPTVSKHLCKKIAVVMTEQFNQGHPDLHLRKLGIDAEDATFLCQRICCWAYYERDMRDVKATEHNIIVFGHKRWVCYDKDPCELSQQNEGELFSWDDYPRMPPDECQRDLCGCSLAPVENKPASSKSSEKCSGRGWLRRFFSQ